MLKLLDVYFGWVKYCRCYFSCKVLYFCFIECIEWIKNIIVKLVCSLRLYWILRLGSCCDFNCCFGFGVIKFRRV